MLYELEYSGGKIMMIASNDGQAIAKARATWIDWGDEPPVEEEFVIVGRWKQNG
jgi:hypothetical protein